MTSIFSKKYLQRFKWVENQATLGFFKFLNPKLVLPDRKALSNRILTNKTKPKIFNFLHVVTWINFIGQHQLEDRRSNGFGTGTLKCSN
ncbi:MAG: hypothetical protein QOK71_10645 [Nitrososphaeraceae archaeon]|nr:hypothetical protein [Nitrososphaeraceae archaeon]